MLAEKETAGIKKMPLGKTFMQYCVVRNKEIKYKQNGNPYLVLELGDYSGRLKAKIWDKVEEYSKITKVGSIVKIQAMVEAIHDQKELKIQKLRSVTKADKIELEDLLPRSNCDIEQLKNTLNNHITSIKNPHLKQLLNKLFDDENFRKDYFMSPSGKLWHHNYLSGMLEHVVAMLDISDQLYRYYPVLDIDLLKTAIICHDIGKVNEYSYNGFIDFSDEGRLIGHITMGFEIVSQMINRVENFPKALKTQLLHLIISHQGDSKFGSPVLPMTLEAIVLQYLILLDANSNALCRIQDNDALPDSRWTKYIPLLDRFIFVGPKSEKNEPHDNKSEI
jgi:3'-5' exoribonuclease